MASLETTCVDEGGIFLKTVAVDVTLPKDEEIEEEEEECKTDADNTLVTVTTSLQEDSSGDYIPIPLALISLSDGGQTLFAADSFVDKDALSFANVTILPVQQDSDDEQSQLVDSFEIPTASLQGNVIQLENGKFAYINAQLEDGCHVIRIEDGTPAFLRFTNTDKEPSETITDTIESEDSLQVDEKKSTKSNSGFRCTYQDCGRVYSTMHHLRVHERSHTGTRPYVCFTKGCNKAFATDYGRKAHVRTHTGEKPYHCKFPICGKSFKTSGDLQKHVRTHTGERPFTCPVSGCDRSFTTSNIRKVHIRTHTGEKPYACTHAGCERSFASATNFKNHMRIHSGEKPFVCEWPLCQKRFTEYSSLYKHNMVHTKQKPYHCNLCNNAYRQASTLTAHKRVTHAVIETDDGTEIVIGGMLGVSGPKKLKNLANNLINLRDKGNTIFAVQSNNGLDDQEQIFILSENLATLQNIDEETQLEEQLNTLSDQ